MVNQQGNGKLRTRTVPDWIKVIPEDGEVGLAPLVSEKQNFWNCNCEATQWPLLCAP